MRSYLGGVRQLNWKDGAYLEHGSGTRLYDGRCVLVAYHVWQNKVNDTTPNYLKCYDSGGTVGVITYADFANALTVDFESGNETITFASSGDQDKTSIGDYITSTCTANGTKITANTSSTESTISPNSISTGSSVPNTTFDRETIRATFFWLGPNINGGGENQFSQIPQDGLLFEDGLVVALDELGSGGTETLGISFYVR